MLVDRNDMALVFDNIQFDYVVEEQGRIYTNSHSITFKNKVTKEVEIRAELVRIDTYKVTDPKGVIQKTLDEIEELSSEY